MPGESSDFPLSSVQACRLVRASQPPGSSGSAVQGSRWDSNRRGESGMNTQLVVGAIVDYHYDYVLVALSFVISVLGSYVSLSLAARARKGGDAVYGPAFALGGCAIWSMHFIGMIAYKTPLYVSYAMGPAALSLVISILIVG